MHSARVFDVLSSGDEPTQQCASANRESEAYMAGLEKIRWSPKVHPRRILAVYESHASDLPDEDLIDDLGISLLLRCQSVLRAMAGEVECPRCGHVFSLPGERSGSPRETACPAGCGWRTTRECFNRSKRHRELNGAESVVPIFGCFVSEYPRCRTPREKLLRIDRLLHEFHWDGKSKLPNRSLSNNLIEGGHAQVIQFLDDLSAVDPALKAKWRATVDVMWKRRRNQLPLQKTDRVPSRETTQ